MITIDEGLGFDTFARDRFDFGRIKLEGGADWRENAISADRLTVFGPWKNFPAVGITSVKHGKHRWVVQLEGALRSGPYIGVVKSNVQSAGKT